jgi:hypothetical protein
VAWMGHAGPYGMTNKKAKAKAKAFLFNSFEV